MLHLWCKCDHTKKVLNAKASVGNLGYGCSAVEHLVGVGGGS